MADLLSAPPTTGPAPPYLTHRASAFRWEGLLLGGRAFTFLNTSGAEANIPPPPIPTCFPSGTGGKDCLLMPET